MAILFRAVYFASLVLWIPLLWHVLRTKGAPARRIIVAAIVPSLLAFVYECYMTFVWAPTVHAPIRIDVFAVMCVLGLVDAAAGCAVLFTAWSKGSAPEKPIGLKLGVCFLAIPVLGVISWYGSFADIHRLRQTFDQGRQLQFETAFRDDDTQKRFFGELHSANNPWSGYYVGGDGVTGYRHLIINEDGQFWLYNAKLYVMEGKGHQDIKNPGQFAGVGKSVAGTIYLSLERESDQTLHLHVKQAANQAVLSALFKKSAPPRYPVAVSQSDQVKFVGVFSAIYSRSGNSFWVAQIWLWESHGHWWGQYLRDYYTQGRSYDFVHPEAIEPSCAGSCEQVVLSFASSRGPVTLTKVSDNELKAHFDGVPEDVILKRGETVPGSSFELAPLASAEQNSQWLNAMTTGKFMTWDVPK